jgi:hypothetical protein
MNEISFADVYWNKWFQLGGIIMFVCGILFSTLFPFINWHKNRAIDYADFLNKINETLPPEKNIVNDSGLHDRQLMAIVATRLLAETTDKYFIKWDDSQRKFVVADYV